MGKVVELLTSQLASLVSKAGNISFSSCSFQLYTSPMVLFNWIFVPVTIKGKRGKWVYTSMTNMYRYMYKNDILIIDVNGLSGIQIFYIFFKHYEGR